MTTDEIRLTAWVHGRVQGVGMRWWIRARALELGLAGWARNLEDGRVEVVAEGSNGACRALLQLLAPSSAISPEAAAVATRPGQITTVVERWGAATGLAGSGGSRFVER